MRKMETTGRERGDAWHRAYAFLLMAEMERISRGSSDKPLVLVTETGLVEEQIGKKVYIRLYHGTLETLLVMAKQEGIRILDWRVGSPKRMGNHRRLVCRKRWWQRGSPKLELTFLAEKPPC